MGSSINLSTPVYFFHIPKTSGRFLWANAMLLLEHELLIRGIDYGPVLKGFGHRSFKPIDTLPILSINFLREPVARTVSHYLHIYNFQYDKEVAKDKIKFMDFLNSNTTKGIIDYQTKFISYDGDDELVNIDETGLPIVIEKSHIDLAYKRINKVDILFNMENQGYDLVQKLLIHLFSHFNLPLNNKNLDSIVPKFPPTINPASTALYNTLTSSEKQEIADLMVNDMNLYHSVKFTDPNTL